MALVDRLVLRFAVDLPGRGVDHLAQVLAAGRFGDVGGADNVEGRRGIRLRRGAVNVAHPGQVADHVDACAGALDRGQVQQVSLDRGRRGQLRRGGVS